tara:strand:- start:10157 stop:10981 length:825 start_codon:yes stop_codon:yes gene_type:complete
MIKASIIKTFKYFGIEIYKKGISEELSFYHQSFYKLWTQFTYEEKKALAHFLPDLHSQYGQDLFVLFCNYKIPLSPLFVEFGAADGILWNNSYIFEKILNWDGLLCEPSNCFRENLVKNRVCKVDSRCVSKTTGNFLEFIEVREANEKFKISSPQLSCLEESAPKDWATKIRKGNSKKYKVETVSLNDVLLENKIPKEIGYMSIDTEGSEVDILKGFDINKYKIDVITIEHNHRSEDMKFMDQYFLKNKYKKVFPDISESDYWYLRDEIYKKIF